MQFVGSRCGPAGQLLTEGKPPRFCARVARNQTGPIQVGGRALKVARRCLSRRKLLDFGRHPLRVSHSTVYNLEPNQGHSTSNNTTNRV